jgi:hypothetical protein
MDQLQVKAETSHCLLPKSHPNSARHSVGHQYTQAFLHITGPLPAKHMITKGLALHLSLAEACEPGGARVGMETSYPRFTAPVRIRC